jgi:hypothetical protein
MNRPLAKKDSTNTNGEHIRTVSLPVKFTGNYGYSVHLCRTALLVEGTTQYRIEIPKGGNHAFVAGRAPASHSEADSTITGMGGGGWGGLDLQKF